MFTRIAQIKNDLFDVCKLSYQYAEASRFGLGSLGMSVVVSTAVRDYNVFVNDQAVGAIAGIPSRVPMAMVSKINLFGVGLQYGYVVNQKFMEQDDSFKKCCLLHEEAHVYYRHDELVKSHIGYQIKRMFAEPEFEYQADKYAHDVVGQEYIEFLNSLKTYSLLHIDARIKRLQVC